MKLPLSSVWPKIWPKSWPRQWPGTILREHGILSMNQRNGDVIMPSNPRRFYPLVDDKFQTKKLAEAAGIATPELYGVVETEHDIRRFEEIIGDHQSFVIKPAQGSGGKGILVIVGRRSEGFVKPNGAMLSAGEVAHHISNVLSGMFSLGGLPDRALIEYCVQFDPVFQSVAYHGVPDIRTIVYRGLPVAAMIRLPTRSSDGKANLHQGAVGAGIDLITGKTVGAVSQNQQVTEHPDTGAALIGLEIPNWGQLLDLSTRCFDLAKLGYLGVDVVLDKDLGPLVLELNARPGLSIQLANGRGLVPRIERVTALKSIPDDPAARLELALKLAAETA